MDEVLYDDMWHLIVICSSKTLDSKLLESGSYVKVRVEKNGSAMSSEFFAFFSLLLRRALLKVDFVSRGQCWASDLYVTYVKKSTLKSTLLEFKSEKSDRDSTPP